MLLLQENMLFVHMNLPVSEIMLTAWLKQGIQTLPGQRHRDFFNLSTKVGRVGTRKYESVSQFGEF